MTARSTTTHPASASSLKRFISRHPLVAFFGLAFLGSWIVWLPLVLAGNNLLLPSTAISPGLRFLLTVLAPFAGPTLAAFVTTAVIDGTAGVRALLRRWCSA